MNSTTQHQSDFGFFNAKRVILIIVLLFAVLLSKAQTRGVWGDLSETRPQKAGETYAGFKAGFGGAPNGLSVFTHLAPNQGLEFTLGYNNHYGNTSPIMMQRGNTFFGVAYQPRVNFRTGDINGAYYINIAGRTRMHNYRMAEEGEMKTIAIQEKSLITPEIAFGFGASLEIYKKVQFFAEMNQSYQAEPYCKENKNCYSFSAIETNLGIRAFIF